MAVLQCETIAASGPRKLQNILYKLLYNAMLTQTDTLHELSVCNFLDLPASDCQSVFAYRIVHPRLSPR